MHASCLASATGSTHHQHTSQAEMPNEARCRRHFFRRSDTGHFDADATSLLSRLISAVSDSSMPLFTALCHSYTFRWQLEFHSVKHFGLLDDFHFFDFAEAGTVCASLGYHQLHQLSPHFIDADRHITPSSWPNLILPLELLIDSGAPRHECIAISPR